jgi:hypothetical protein
MTTVLLIIGGLVVLFFAVLFFMSLPGIMRYIRISRM